MEKIKLLLQQLEQALNKLKDAFKLKNEEIVRDGTIQRFEFTFELSWKLMQRINNFYGIETNSPRQVIKKAFKEKIISDNALWLESLECKNIIAHTYGEDMALKIYSSIKNFVPFFEELIINVKGILNEEK